MPHLLTLVLDQLHHVGPLLEAWRSVGVRGVTILESTGGYRTMTWLERVGAPLGLVLPPADLRRRTLMAFIEDDQTLASAIAEAERVVGDFSRPHTGVLAVLPVAQALGLQKAEPAEAVPAPPPAMDADVITLTRATPVSQIARLLVMEPVIVQEDATLDSVIRAVVPHPHTHVVCVVTAQGRLSGLLPVQAIASDVFLRMIPEEFLQEMTTLEQVAEFAKALAIRRARDAMIAPLWVQEHETLEVAFRRMHDSKLDGLPLVDQEYHVIGYVNLVSLLNIWLQMM